MTVVAFSGSLRTGSWNTKLLAVAVEALKARGVTVDVWDFRAAQVPIYEPDTHEAAMPPQVLDLKERIRRAKGLVIASPEFNYSIPGALKNLLDFLSRPPKDNPFRGKLVAQLGATPGPGGTLQGQVMLRHVVSGLGAMSFPGAVTVSRAADAFDEASQLKDAAARANLDGFLDRYVAELKLRP